METLCCSVWNDHSWHLTSLLVNFSGSPTAAAYVSVFQNKMNLIVTYWAVCMYARVCVCVCLLIVSVDFSLFIFHDRLQCRIANCNARIRLLSAPTHILQRRRGRRVLFPQHLLRDLTHNVSMEMTLFVVLLCVVHVGIKDRIRDNMFLKLSSNASKIAYVCLPSYILIPL